MKTDQDLDAAIALSGARELAERQILALLQDPEGPLDLRITHRAGEWTIRLDSPGDGAGPAFATGGSFAEAWHHIAPAWAKGCNDNEGEG